MQKRRVIISDQVGSASADAVATDATTGSTSRRGCSVIRVVAHAVVLRRIDAVSRVSRVRKDR
jgi:hypothetical protein